VNPLAKQAQEVIRRSRAILVQSWIVQLCRAITYCKIAKRKNYEVDGIPYLLVAEATSATFIKLRSQGKLIQAGIILDLMGCLEVELGGKANALICTAHVVKLRESGLRRLTRKPGTSRLFSRGAG